MTAARDFLGKTREHGNCLEQFDACLDAVVATAIFRQV